MTQKLTPDEIRARLSEGETADTFLVQGRHAVAAALASNFAVEAVASTGSFPEGLAERDIPTLSLSKAEAEALLGFAFHRGLLAIARKPVKDFSEWVTTHFPRRIVVLENLADPGNVGTVIRNAAAFGFDAVVCSAAGASPYNAKAVRASATGVFHLPVFVEEDWRRAVEVAMPAMKWIGTDVSEGAESLEAIVASGLRDAFAVVLGSEGDGLSAETLAACHRRVHIPISQRVESLNVASASAILLHALGRAEDRK